jgi:phenylalanyl-tRNA synthetase alpha chain
MKEKVKQLIDNATELIKNSSAINEINDLRVKYLGKTGEVTSLLKGMKDVPNDQKAEVGKYVNQARDTITNLITSKLHELEQKALEAKMMKERIDITVDNVDDKRGALHPCSLVIDEVTDIFTGMGFTVGQGTETETDMFNFQLLNIPKDHPSRDMQDTFYIGDDLLLRTQTSAMQARIMQKTQPPIKIICPGKVYRPDYDATHSPMFSQIEGLVVDKHVTLCDLKGLLDLFAKKLFDENTKTRFRPSYFPFTEPSVEVDVTCAVCHGKGCRICKGTGWIEILGAGVVNPKVLDDCGIDSKQYSGLAFGLGVERIAMIKYGIPDIRILYENDVRFLKSFK